MCLVQNSLMLISVYKIGGQINATAGFADFYHKFRLHFDCTYVKLFCYIVLGCIIVNLDFVLCYFVLLFAVCIVLHSLL